MNDSQRRKFEMYGRQLAAMGENAADFPADSSGKVTSDLLEDVVLQIESHDSAKLSGANAAQMSVANKDDAIDRLLVLMRGINRAANAMDGDVPNIDEMFRIPRKRTDLNILTAARQFKEDAEPHAETFVEYGLPLTFIADLEAQITVVENYLGARDAAIGKRGGATAALVALFKTADKYSRKLDSIVRNKYAQNPQKLASWTIASHLERAPKKPKTPNPPPQP